MKKIKTSETLKHTDRMTAVLVSGLLLISSIGTAEAGRPAIEGYDTVAYYTMMQAVKGSESIKHKWLGEDWYFVNEQHRDMFSADPMRYTPNYGGYCSYDMETYSEGKDHRHKVDPTAWRIVEGKLYIFFAEKNASRMVANEKWENVKKNWDKVKTGLTQ